LEYTLEDFAGVVPTQVNATGIFTGLPIGNYKITVINKETGCSLQKVHYVNNPNTFDLSVDTVVDVTCFSGFDGSVNVTFIDRFPTPTNKAGSFSYTVVNALGVHVANGTTPNAGPISIKGLASGTYTIKASLTGSPFCAVDKNFTITAPSAALTISETHTEITCVSGNNDGSIFATATGGWPGGYEFELSGAMITTIPYSTNGYFKNLSAGIYTISVKDSRGCIATKTVELTNPLPITVTASADINMLTCFGDKNATITVDLPTGGQGSNYSYTLNMISPVASSSGPQLSPVFSGLGAGTYTITVTDGYSCSATSVNVDIKQPTPIVASLVAATTPTCLTNATLTLSATGGTGSYIYSKTSTFATIEGAFTSPITFAVTPGTYKYYVRDTNGCLAVVTNDIKIDAVPELQINLDLTNASINCAGDDTGVIVATAQGGLGNYVYTLQDAQGKAIPAVQNRPGVFTELFAGIYYVKVDSGNCQDISEKIEITEPVAPLNVDYSKIDVSCYGANNGSIEIIATGGSGAIKYAISPQLNQFFDSNVFENLAPGTYDIIVQDTLGCYEHLNITITEPAAPVSIIPNLILSEVCQGDNDAMFSISVSGGIAPYDVSLVGYDGPYTTGTGSQFDFTGLKGGDHAVFVRDSNGCESEWNITVPESVKIEPVAVVDYLCDDNSPGNRVTVTVDATITDLSDLDYSLDGGKTYQASNVFNDLVIGTGYSIQVRHSDGCIQETALFDIVHVNPLLLDLNDGGLNEIVALAAGGTGDYKFTLNGEDYGSTSSFIITKSGEYTVTVTDSSGCVAMATRHFEFIDLCIPNYFTPNGDNNQDTWAPGCAINYPNMEFKIFDRYGREVGNYRLGQAWDGRYKERELPTGDYWYIIKLNNSKDNRDFVGHFTLYR
ncbi:T9SS type B sorting domain-containing protein, partial [Gelidibacter sp.]|uniref:T9SS type B sorting domain-containing protein n=1 Tax=Gelidibacter sp. TaxID=2018083 RepID=UPI0032647A1A